MIRPLRRAHARAWMLLLPAILIAIGVALMLRTPPPIQYNTPTVGASATP